MKFYLKEAMYNQPKTHPDGICSSGMINTCQNYLSDIPDLICQRYIFSKS